MKKQILSLLLILCMVTTLLPTVAFAATNYNIWVGSTQVTSDNASDVLGDGTVSFDSSTSTLTLNNANITSSAGSYPYFGWEHCLIFFAQASTLRLLGDNTVDASGISGVVRLNGMLNTAPLTISGSGKLTVKGGSSSGISSGIGLSESLTIDGCRVTAYSEDTIASFIQGIWDWNSAGVTVKNGATLTMGAPAATGYGYRPNGSSSLFTIDDTSTVITKGGAQAGQMNISSAINNPNLLVTGSESYEGTNAAPITSNDVRYKYIEVKPCVIPAAVDFTFTPPANLTYSGTAKAADISSPKAGMGTVTVKYYKDGALVTSPKGAGTYTAKIDVAMGTSYGAATDITDSSWTFTIAPLDITGAAVSAFAPLTYNGTAQTPSAAVTKGDLTATGTWSAVTSLSDKTSFTANGNFTGTISDKSTGMSKGTPSYTLPIGLTATFGQTLADISLPSEFAWTAPTTNVGNAGTKSFTASYTPTDTDNYNIVNNININVTVSAKNINFSIEDIADANYNGSAHTPAVVVKDGITTLVKDTDYTVSYSNNTNAVTATVTVTGKGNYVGSIGTKTFIINPFDITGAAVSAFAPLTYNGTAQTPSATVTKNSLTATGTWSAVTNVGQTTTFTASGNFTGTIADKNPGMAKAMPAYTTPLGLTAVYGQTLANVALPSGFAWTNSTASVGNVGTHSFTVIYTPNDTVNYNTVNNISVNIVVSAKLTTFSVEDIAAVTYNGTAHTPAVVVRDGATTLTKDLDYTVSYSNNTNAGTATVTVTGKGNYASSNGTKTFTINSANVTNSKNDQTVTYAGQTHDVSGLFIPDSNAGTPSYTIEAGGTGEGTLSGNILTITKAGTIVIGLITAQTANYNAGSKMDSTLTVNKGIQNAPAGITKLNVTAKDGNDGKIQNVSTAMEYKTDGGEYTDVTGDAITGLPRGVYAIRYKQTEVYNAGPDIQLTIDEPAVIKADETVPDGITLETPTQSGNTLEIKVTKASVAAPEITTISGSKMMAIVLDITAEVNGMPTATLTDLIKITFPIPEAAKGRSITVYRLHEGTATEMPAGEANKNADGEYIVIGTDTIVIYAKNFSQYAIAYTKPSSGGGSATPSYKITVTQSEGGKISPDTVSVIKNSSKKFTVTPNDGYEIEDVLVDAKSVGAFKEYTFEKVTSATSITAKFKKIEEKPTPSLEPTEPINPAKWENPFTDVNENDWFYEAVKYVSENGLMNGTDNITFAPDTKVTRAMFVTVLYRAEKQPNVGVSPFADIESGAYYEKAIAWAAVSGIVKGVSETEFAPNGTITREQLATIIQRYAIFKGLDTAVSKTTSYADSASISDYAKEAVAFCTEKGIMSGKDSNLFDPLGYATRAEVAAVLTKVLKILQ